MGKQSSHISTTEGRALRFSSHFDSHDSPLCLAARQGDFEKLDEVIKSGAFSEDFSKAMWISAARGHKTGLEMLLAVANPRAEKSLALQLAARFGRDKCVEILIPLSTPKADGSLALKWAIQGGHLACASLLIPVSDLSDRLGMGRLAEDIALDSKRHDMFALLESVKIAESMVDAPLRHAGCLRI